ncbi:MAG TPA: HD domain-containing protein [Acidimicrobiales bacterium]|jgi:hypothetical protein
MTSSRFGSPVHLARRFFTSLRSTPPPAADDAWAESKLLPGESALWRRLSGSDRRHAVGVGRATAMLLGGEASTDRAVLAAALLHDVGKVEARLGTVSRAAVTAWALAVGPERLARGDGRAARYLRHADLGAAMLSAAGSDPLTVQWTLEHHRPPEDWTVPQAVGEALKAADDD